VSAEPNVPSAEDTTSIDLETEPLVFFHPTLAGLVPPGKVQPVPATLLLEEEPAIWPQLGGG
jgi:hypothetical protein